MAEDNVVSDLYNELIIKKNKCKIDLDNCIAEIEITKKSLEYKSSIEDDSRFFSPRSTGNGIDSENDLKLKLDNYEKIAESKKNELDHYDRYCKRLAEYLQLNIGESADTDIQNNEKNNVNNIRYSINLNYNMDDIKSRLINLKNMTELSIKIFDNDRERARQELKNIDKMLDKMINEL